MKIDEEAERRRNFERVNKQEREKKKAYLRVWPCALYVSLFIPPDLFIPLE